MSFTDKLHDFTVEVSTKIKDLRVRVGDLSGLNTSVKTNVVSAVNEVNTKIDGVVNDVTPGLSTAYSSSKTDQKIADRAASLKIELVGTASGAGDTLGELQALLLSDETGAAAMSAAIANRLRIDADGGYTTVQKQRGRDNLDVYSKAEIGDIVAWDPVADFNAGLA